MWYQPHGWTHDPSVYLYANFENSGTDFQYWTARCAAAAKWAFEPSDGPAHSQEARLFSYEDQ